MARHPIRRSRIKAVAREKSGRGIRSDDASIEEHCAYFRMLGTKLNIMRDHDDCNALFIQLLQE
ncbi:hypothetical protein D3C78_1943060 [compost metagenome]